MGHLGYAVTAHRAQGSTVDTAHAIVHSPEMTRESLYVAMTRGRESNRVYVATDEYHLEEHQHRDDLAMTARSVLYGILQHPGAELSAHETTTVEQDVWGSLSQLAAEYDTIAQEAQQDRWVALLEQAGLEAETIDELVETESFGILTTELRRLEADGHDIDGLLPRVIAAGNLDNVDDLGSVLRYRIQKITTIYPPSRPRTAGLVAGLVPRATGITDPVMRHALTERERLMVQRVDALADAALEQPAPWMRELATADATRRFARSLPTGTGGALPPAAPSQLGHEVTHEYHDDGTSRSTLDLLLPEILAGSNSTLIIASIDRLGRSIADNERTNQALSEADVEIYAADIGTVLISPQMMHLMNVIAAADVEDDLTPTP